jgi:hypothetical protein
MSRSLLALGAAIVLISPAAGALAQSAQGAVQLSTLEIALWPEFDEPELLVIFQGRLSDEVPLPTVLTLSMPREVGEPHAVASVDEENRRLTAAYELQEVGDEIRVTYTSLQNRGFQFEYYWDAIRVDGQARQFTFSFAPDFPVGDFSLELQQPFDATNVTLSPPAVETATGFGNLTYHQRPFGAVEAGQAVTWRVSYDKPSALLSAETLPTPVPGPGPTPAGATGDSQVGIIAAVGAALVAAVVLLLILYNRRQTPSRQRYAQSRPSKRRRRKETRAQSLKPTTATLQPPETAFPEGGFCHRCGAALTPDALFCHRCGTRRKGT